jgi:G3E family GTPase
VSSLAVSTPFDKATSSIPVTVVTSDAVPEQPDDVALIRLEPALHEHPPGEECIACATRADVRAMLFDLLTAARSGGRKPFSRVVLDASRLRDPQRIIDRLDPHAPAIGLRDHTVARSFHLTRVI